MNHATFLVKPTRDAWLSKADITSAFQVLPKESSSKNSPELFGSLSEALSWSFSNSHKLPCLVHRLDNFLVVSPRKAPLAHGLSLLKPVFTELGGPENRGPFDIPGVPWHNPRHHAILGFFAHLKTHIIILISSFKTFSFFPLVLNEFYFSPDLTECI